MKAERKMIEEAWYFHGKFHNNIIILMWTSEGFLDFLYRLFSGLFHLERMNFYL